MSPDMDTARLYIFPPSSGCEVAAWLLQQYQIVTRVNRQTAPFFMFSILLHGGKDYPFVIYRGKKLSSSLAVSLGLEAMAPKTLKLYPSDPALKQEAAELWEKIINPKLAFAVSRWAYFYLLPRKDLLKDSITQGVPGWQKFLVNIAYRPIAGLIGKSLGISKQPPAKEEGMIREVFDLVDQRLSDGRNFLVGDRLSMVDIGFAGLAAPVVLEENYGHGGLLPTLVQAPEAMQPMVREMRARPAGQFIQRMYRDYR